MRLADQIDAEVARFKRHPRLGDLHHSGHRRPYPRSLLRQLQHHIALGRREIAPVAVLFQTVGVEPAEVFPGLLRQGKNRLHIGPRGPDEGLQPGQLLVRVVAPALQIGKQRRRIAQRRIFHSAGGDQPAEKGVGVSGQMKIERTAEVRSEFQNKLSDIDHSRSGRACICRTANSIPN